MAMAPEQMGIGIRRHFTTAGVHPYEQVAWERRDARIVNFRDGSVAFEQLGVEVPTFWSQNATNILAQKYFRGTLGTAEREWSLKQVADRVADTIADWGIKDGYFVDDVEADTFRDELKYLIIHQRAAFNSPVWFNIGVEGVPQQASACFILSVEDTMDAILDWYKEEGIIFKGGSGSGINLSKIRSSRESLKGGGTASGPVSFMRGADASAGTIKCLDEATELMTDRGVLPIAEVQPGDKISTRFGMRPVSAVFDNGVRPLVRVASSVGDDIRCTHEHRFWTRSVHGEGWIEAGQLRQGDAILLDLEAGIAAGSVQQLVPVAPGHHNELAHDLPAVLDEAFGLWLGLIWGDGSITDRPGAKFVALQVGDADPELTGRYIALTRSIFGEGAHLFVDRHNDKSDASASVRFCSSQVLRFLEANGLRKPRASALEVPAAIKDSPAGVRAAFLAGLFEADGHVQNGYPMVSTVSPALATGVHRLLASLGIPSTIKSIRDRSQAYGTLPVFTVRVLGCEGVRRFAKVIGFVSDRKQRKLDTAVVRKNASPFETSWVLPHAGSELQRIWQAGDQQIRRAVAPYVRFRAQRTLSLLRARALVDRFPDAFAGTAVERFAAGHTFWVTVDVAADGEGRVFDLCVEDVHEYLVHNFVTHNSGGKTRRAAKMVILNADHPDVEDFIWCKAIEERKARVLRDAGFDMDLDGKDSHSTQYQNANNSVRVTDEFMQAVLDDADWHLRAVIDGRILETVKARDLFRQINKAAWECADPGLQYDTTINRWHTAPNTGRINASNPCFTGDALVHTDKGLLPFKELFARANEGESFGVYTHDVTSPEAPAERVELTTPEAFMITGVNEIVKLRFDRGMEVRCTAGHRFFTTNRGYVAAADLTSSDEVKVLDLPAPAVNADLCLPIPTAVDAYHEKGDHNQALRLPEEWSEEFAHYLGWLVGDGSTSGSTVATIYGSVDDRVEVLPRHQDLLHWVNGDRPIKLSEQANGTAQLRLGRRAFKRFIEALGVRSVKGPEKTVPWSVEQAPASAVAAFLQGLYDADGCARLDAQKGSYVGLGSTSRQLLIGVQRLLTTFGVSSHIYAVHDGRGATNFAPYERKDGTLASYGRSPSWDLRISSGSIALFAAHIGFSLSAKAENLARMITERRRGFYTIDTTTRLVERTDDGVELTYNLTEPRNHSYVVNGLVVRNCSEYVHLDNSACNLASINLLRYHEEDGIFDVGGFQHSVEVVFTAQEILVGNADYPTEKIAATTRRFRQLGLGYANLGALLMALGLAYDSDEGRALAASITALMTGHAYATSARTAMRMGPFAGYHDNREPMNDVLRMHRAEVAKIDEELVPIDLLMAAQESWDQAVELAEVHGVRNSQSTVLAPTGTISFLLDCDTTGIEPDLGLVKTKKLVGGGNMSIVNQTVPRALRRLGYNDEQIEAIVAYIDEHKSIVGAPALRSEHLPVFACSMGDNTIHYTGHVRMMGAVQPFISGAISKCVTGDSLVATADGLVRIGGLHDGELADSFRDEIIEVASLGGTAKTDAFYYGGVRPVREVVLRSGHRLGGTPNHRVLVGGDAGLTWKALGELELGDTVATQYGSELWAQYAPQFSGFQASPPYGSQKQVRLPHQMTDELAFLLGAYASEGHTTRSTWTVTVTNSVDAVLERVAAAWRSEFGLEARIVRQLNKCPSVIVSSKSLVEFLEWLGCGARASEKRIPDAILRSPRTMVLAFLQGLALDAYVTVSTAPKWGICLDSPKLLDDLQAILTNLGVLHGRVRKANKVNGKIYDEVYAAGKFAQLLADLVPFVEPDKAARASVLNGLTFVGTNTADLIPGITPLELHGLLPRGKSGRGGFSVRTPFAFLTDPRTKYISRRTLERVSVVRGVELPAWLQQVLDDDLHFSPVEAIGDTGEREVFDLSVPSTHAFVANGIVSHNTVNMPEEASIEDVEQLHIDAWRLGLKAVAIYRDNCKVAQPLSTTKKTGEAAALPSSAAEAHDAELARKVEELEQALNRQTVVVKQPIRERLPRRRRSSTFAFRVADCEGYVTVGEYEDGRPGEVFMKVSKQGSTLAGIMDAFSISVSLGLQHGVPLSTYVRKYTNMRFEPAGMTDDAELRIASSLVDYIFRRLAVDYLPYEERAELGILTTGERTQPTLPGVEEATTPMEGLVEVQMPAPAEPSEPTIDVRPAAEVTAKDAPYCYQCGNAMQRAGSCFVCTSCGTTSGCS